MARPRPAGTRTLSQRLLRPYALSGRPEGLWLALVAIASLLVVFVGDAVTPRQIALSALGLIPLLAAMWLLSDGLALVVGAVAIGQLLATAVLGSLSVPTVASEGAAYIVLAFICRLYAQNLAAVLTARPPEALEGNGHPGERPVSLAAGPMVLLARASDNLTPREQQVARLAAQGFTAREIGVELHIGRRTVETHLANAYDKLGVRSKRELIRSVRSSN